MDIVPVELYPGTPAPAPDGQVVSGNRSSGSFGPPAQNSGYPLPSQLWAFGGTPGQRPACEGSESPARHSDRSVRQRRVAPMKLFRSADSSHSEGVRFRSGDATGGVCRLAIAERVLAGR